MGPVGKDSSSPALWRNIQRYGILRGLCHSIRCSASDSVARQYNEHVLNGQSDGLAKSGEMTMTQTYFEWLSQASPSVQLQQLISGHWIAQAIAVAAELGIADLLAEGPRSSDDLAQAAGCHAG